MSVKNQLATALGRRDETPNQELARSIAASGNRDAIAELAGLLRDKDKNYQADAIKTLYETGYLNPALIAGHWQDFLRLLSSKNNRLVWGAMIALHTIAGERPDELYEHLPAILQAADEGSVITNDAAVGILIKLSGHAKYGQTVFPLLLEKMLGCPANQFPMYAENAMSIITPERRVAFAEVIKSRLPGLSKESQVKRVMKVLKKTER